MSNDTGATSPAATPAAGGQIENAEQANAVLNDGAKRAAIAKAPGDFSTLSLRNEQVAAREFLQRHASTDGVTQAPTPPTMDAPNPMAAAFAPMTDIADVREVELEGKAQGLRPVDAAALANFAALAGIPKGTAKGLALTAANIMKAQDDGYTMTRQLTRAEQAEHAAELQGLLGANTGPLLAKARAYIKTCSPKVQEIVNSGKLGSMAYSAKLIIALASLYDARKK